MSTTKQDPLVALYEALAAQKDKRPTTVRDGTLEERRAYMRDAQRAHRARKRAAAAEGSPMPTDDAVRTALGDAAIMLLGTDGPGSREILSALVRAFPGRPGVPTSVQARCRSGTLRPAMLTAMLTAEALTKEGA